MWAVAVVLSSVSIYWFWIMVSFLPIFSLITAGVAIVAMLAFSGLLEGKDGKGDYHYDDDDEWFEGERNAG
jgi:hypothetical protein